MRDAEPLREEIRERQRRKDCVKDVGLVRESDFFDHHLMNWIFFEIVGAGPGTLTLAGIEVSKDIRGFSSNRGKTTGFASTFTWTGSDGVPAQLEFRTSFTSIQSTERREAELGSARMREAANNAYRGSRPDIRTCES